MRIIKLSKTLTSFLAETRFQEMVRAQRTRSDPTKSAIMNLSRHHIIDFGADEARSMLDKLFRVYSSANKIPINYAVLDADGFDNGEWRLKDSAVQPAPLVQDVITGIEKNYNFLGIFAMVSNPEGRRLITAKSILIYPTGRVPKDTKQLEIGEMNVYVPGLGEENLYTLDNDIKSGILPKKKRQFQ